MEEVSMSSPEFCNGNNKSSFTVIFIKDVCVNYNRLYFVPETMCNYDNECK
jgi:hypothetical protein